MLEIKMSAISLDEKDLLELERIITDNDEKDAWRFLKKATYDQILLSHQCKLKSHLDATNPVEGFIHKTE